MNNGLDLLFTFIEFIVNLIVYCVGLAVGWRWKSFGLDKEEPQDRMLIIALSISIFLLYLIARYLIARTL